MEYGSGEKRDPREVVDLSWIASSKLKNALFLWSRKSSKGGRKPAWMNKGLLAKLGHKKEVGMSQGKVTREEYRHGDHACRDGVRKARAHLE